MRFCQYHLRKRMGQRSMLNFSCIMIPSAYADGTDSAARRLISVENDSLLSALPFLPHLFNYRDEHVLERVRHLSGPDDLNIFASQPVSDARNRTLHVFIHNHVQTLAE